MARGPRKRKAAPRPAAKRKATAKVAAPSKKAGAPRRPPEVSAAEWAKWSPSYRKRAAGFYEKHPGAPRYQMRGKGAGEHLTRKQRNEARWWAWAERQSYRGQQYGARSPAEIVESIRRLVRDHGESAFTQMERRTSQRHNEWREAGQPYTGSPRSLGHTNLSGFDDWDWVDDYDGEDSEQFYH